MSHEKLNKKKKAEQWDRENAWKEKKKKVVKKKKMVKKKQKRKYKQPSPTLCCSHCNYKTKVAAALELHDELCAKKTKPLIIRRENKLK
jgi:hypothetical protein